MKIFQMQSVMVTAIYLKKDSLITEEKVKSYSNGEQDIRRSFYDDLETLFEELQLGKNPSRCTRTYHLPKLTVDQLALVDSKDKQFFRTFDKMYPYVFPPYVFPKKKMETVSDSEFILGVSQRRTFRISLNKRHTSAEKKSSPPLCQCLLL